MTTQKRFSGFKSFCFPFFQELFVAKEIILKIRIFHVIFGFDCGKIRPKILPTFCVSSLFSTSTLRRNTSHNMLGVS